MTNAQWASLGEGGGGAGDQVIYYRRPRKGENAGWITWSDSLSGTKLRDFVRRGFEPMTKYGVINSGDRDRRAFGAGKNFPPTPEFADLEPQAHRARYLWEAILSHPEGPAEFPIEQVVIMGWYRPEQCPVPEARFPQIAGKKIREYGCPERCGRRPFVEMDGIGGVGALRQHLRIIHRWDQSNLQAYGERMGIDFNKADVGELLIEDVATEVVEEHICPDDGFKAKSAFGLQAHERSHQKVAVETIG